MKPLIYKDLLDNVLYLTGENMGYSALYAWAERILGEVPENLTADQFYEARRAYQEDDWEKTGLSEGGKGLVAAAGGPCGEDVRL